MSDFGDRRHSASPLALVMLTLGVLLAAGPLAPRSLAQTPDASEVVLVLDFSASILQDEANRDRFAAALEGIADRVDATTADLVAGDATVTLVQFATRAADYPRCAELQLLGSPDNVARFADCLRDIAAAYRQGLSAALTDKIGVDTNYVAAMRRAAAHLPVDAVRPTLILFTDGKHDVAGVPVGQVLPERDRLFGGHSPFALLPVGMGLSAAERPALEAGLRNLQVIREMPACISGATFDWPQVVFESPADAGSAVALALQNATCTFTVEPSPAATPELTPTPEPGPGAVRNLSLRAGDGVIELDWLAPSTEAESMLDYRARCRTGEGDWVESQEGESLSTSAAVIGLTNGAEYECEVATVTTASVGDWVPAPATATPVGPPAAPVKPVVEALNHALRIHVPEADTTLVAAYRYECSADQGSTWPVQVEIPTTIDTLAQINDVMNGVEYVCRAYAVNDGGVSAASPVSDVARPCGSALECSPVATPILIGIGFLALGGLLMALLGLARLRTRGYVVAVVDVVHSVNLGHGGRLGLRFERAGPNGPVTGVAVDRSRRAEIRIRPLRGDRFEVTDLTGRHITSSGESIVVLDSQRNRHSLTLHGFKTATAAAASAR